MKRRQKKALTLNREAVRLLGPPELDEARGGRFILPSKSILMPCTNACSADCSKELSCNTGCATICLTLCF